MSEGHGWGEGPARQAPRQASPRRPVEEPATSASEPAASASDSDLAAPDSSGPAAVDRLGRIAVVAGCVGIFVLGIVAAVVTGVLAAEAGRRAREQRRSAELAYLALLLAVVDGVFFLFLHYRFKLPVWVG